MDQLNNLIHQPVRLRIMAALKALPGMVSIEFVRLRKIVDATEGNLGSHIQTLEQAGYIEVQKDFVGNKPCTRIKLTKQGRRAFEDYIADLTDLIAGPHS